MNDKELASQGLVVPSENSVLIESVEFNDGRL
jgi:hypothetical protein